MLNLVYVLYHMPGVQADEAVHVGRLDVHLVRAPLLAWNKDFHLDILALEVLYTRTVNYDTTKQQVTEWRSQ